MFLSYHILDRLFASTAKLINCWEYQYGLCQSYGVDFYVVGLFHDKLERVYATVDKQVEHPAGYYINHSTATEYNSYDRVRGAYLYNLMQRTSH